MPELRSITLNLAPSAPSEDWQKVAEVYRGLDGWIAETDWPCWYGVEGAPAYIVASAEPSGLVLSGSLEEALWTGWVSVLCARLSLALGREIRDAEMP